jgi:hypothetical protein
MSSYPWPTTTPSTDISAPVALRQLAGGPRAADELATVTSTHAPSLFRLLRALTAFGVFEEVAPGRFALTPIGDGLRADALHSLRDAVVMWGSENDWQTTADLLHCIQTGETAVQHLFGVDTPFAYYQAHPELCALMNAGWAAIAHDLPQAVVAAYDFPASATVVDVGGNRGQLLGPILRAYPSLRGVLFDLPDVIAVAAPYLEAVGVLDRCTLVSGDMFAAVPSGGDIYLLSRVIHDWDDAQATAILRTCRRSMRPQTTLLLIERVVPATLDPSANVQVRVQSDLNMLIRAGGREHTDAEYEALLAAAGFALDRIIPTPSGFSVITSRAVEPAPSPPSGGERQAGTSAGLSAHAEWVHGWAGNTQTAHSLGPVSVCRELPVALANTVEERSAGA